MRAMRRDQRHAMHAYTCVRRVPSAQQDDYRIAVDTLGPAILRSGLCAALAFLERSGSPASRQLFEDLAGAEIPGLSADGAEAPEHALPERARQLEVDDYMLASREILLVVHWFKRAIQATFP